MSFHFVHYIRSYFHKMEKYLSSTQHHNLPDIPSAVQKDDTGWLDQQVGSIRKYKHNKGYTMIQHLDSEIEEKRIYTFIHIDWLGRIVENDLPEVCKKIEETMDQAKIKSFKREKSLKDLGI
jgi:hypothetical protein